MNSSKDPSPLSFVSAFNRLTLPFCLLFIFHSQKKNEKSPHSLSFFPCTQHHPLSLIFTKKKKKPFIQTLGKKKNVLLGLREFVSPSVHLTKPISTGDPNFKMCVPLNPCSMCYGTIIVYIHVQPMYKNLSFS